MNRARIDSDARGSERFRHLLPDRFQPYLAVFVPHLVRDVASHALGGYPIDVALGHPGDALVAENMRG